MVSHKTLAGLFVATVLAAPMAYAGEPSARAVSLVDGVSATRLAKAELPKGSKDRGRSPSGQSAESEAEIRRLVKGEDDAPLANRLELTAGTDGLLVLSDVSKQVSLFAEGRYRLTRTLQLGGSLAYRFQSGDRTQDSAFQALLGPTFNFGATNSTLGNAFFVSPQLGITTGQTKFGDAVVGSNSQPTAAIHAGKRFQLGESVSYAPSIGMVKEWDFSPSFVVQPLALSVFF